ncbi:MAG: 3-hydroxyacyl-CoA dehydrogenase NAD-binding domain-containing protein [Thermodesulfobacteriota bacterium]|nr:3-hydroxyacyl-CoA dehydrogenase NAD-binding domain-containing protein [Thermodesulfobacteriota bacterium]
MPIKEIKTVCFVGAGTMGCVNSLLSGIGGYNALIYDVSAEALSQVFQRQKEAGAYMVDNKIFDQGLVDAGMSRVSLVSDPVQAAEDADLLSESVSERLELKRKVHKQFDALCPPKTIMTTNTSGLPVSEIEKAVTRSDRFAALHSHLGSGLVDIVGGERTSPETIDILKRYVLSLGCIPLVLKREKPGYLYNSMLGGVFAASLLLVIRGRGGVKAIDRAWMAGQKHWIGPFGMMDYVGLNVVYDSMMAENLDRVWEVWAKKIAGFLRPYVERGELGVKTGKGLYLYPSPAYQESDFLKGMEDGGHLHDVLFGSLACNAIMLVVDGYADVDDVDRAWMAGQNVTTGPFGMLDNKGLDDFLEGLNEPSGMWVYQFGNPEEIAGFLRPYVERGELGKKTGKGFYAYPTPAYQRPEFLTDGDG